MSREDVEVVRRVYEAAARRDAATVYDLYHPEAEIDTSRLPESGLGQEGVQDPVLGHEGLRTLTRSWSAAWESYEDRCEELIDAGDCVLAVVTRLGRGRTSRLEVSARRAGVWTIREGRVVKVVWYASIEEAREAAGLAG